MDLDLTALFDPRSIAVVGASSDPAKWGHILSRRAVDSSVPGSGARRPVALVNRHGSEVLGRSTYPTLAAARRAVGEPLELVVVCVPARGLLDAVTDAVRAGARAVVAITAGLSELGEAGARLEAEVVAVARSAGAVLVGPNCLGIADTGTGLQLAHAVLPRGEVTVLSQSGNLVLDLAPLLAERGLGVARFVSLGNQAALTVVDVMRACVDHHPTRAVAIYAEDVVDGRGFVTAARALAAAGKPVVLLSPGRSAAAARTAVSHTGSMTSPGQVVDAACVAGGIRRADHPTAIANLLEGLLAGRRMAGRRVAVLTDGGGHGAVAADALDLAGLETPTLDGHTRARLGDVLWASSTVTNPVDLAGAGDRDPGVYADAVAVLLAADDVDGVLVTGYFGGYSTEPGRMHELEMAAAEAIAATVGQHAKPVVVHTIHPASPSAVLLRSAGIPVHRDVDRAVAVLAGLVDRPAPPFAPALPVPASPVADPSYDACKRLFASAGIAFPPHHTVRGRAELTAAFATTGFPLVLKALGSAHKSDGGGVVLGLGDERAALAAYDDLVARLHPPAVSVEAMVDVGSGVEVIVGCVRDRVFGPVLMVGLGGVHTEVLADTAYALAPVDHDRARALLLSLRAAPLLLGARGGPPADLDALAAAVVAVSRVAAEHPEIAELEVNPLLASPDGALALDARVALR